VKIIFIVSISLMAAVAVLFVIFAKPAANAPEEAPKPKITNPEVSPAPTSEQEPVLTEEPMQPQEQSYPDELTTIPGTQHITVTRGEIGINGYSGFSFDLDNEYTFEPWANEHGQYRVFDSYGTWMMTINQTQDIGMTVEEWVISMAEFFAIEGNPALGWSSPTEEFPFYEFEGYIYSGAGNVMREFMRDNGRGGIFNISILLFPNQWEEHHGPQLLESLSTFEIPPD